MREPWKADFGSRWYDVSFELDECALDVLNIVLSPLAAVAELIGGFYGLITYQKR